jgi:hypothetical protein
VSKVKKFVSAKELGKRMEKPHQSNLYDPRQVFGQNKNNLPRSGQGARTNPPEPPTKEALHGTAL